MLANLNKPRSSPGISVGEEEMPEWLPRSILAPELYTEDYKNDMRSQYETSAPYRHLRIPKLCDPQVMVKIREEIINNLKTFHRETDLFKVSQSIDFNNIPLESEFAQTIPNLISLRQHLYSPTFRQFLEDTLSCGKLSERVDMAANEYKSGLQLACHDDGVQTTRKLSFIVYSSQTDTSKPVDNMDEWEPKHGGYLELYPGVDAPILPENLPTTSEAIDMPVDSVISVPVPITIPSKLIAPAFNTMVIFEVKPGESFHAVQEVYAKLANRISIQGWFHAAEPKPVPNNRVATVRLLQAPVVVPEPGASACDNALTEGLIDHITANKPMSELSDVQVHSLVQDMFASPALEPYAFLSDTKSSIYEPLTKAVADTLMKPVTEDLSADEEKEVDLEDPKIIKADLAYLRKYINQSYTMVNTIKQVRKDFDATGILSLSNFLRKDVADMLTKCLTFADVCDGLALIPDWNAVTSDGQEEKEKQEGDEDAEEDVEEEEDEDVEYADACTTFHEKAYPPAYTVGITTGEPTVRAGRWVLTGPPYKQRTAVYQLSTSTSEDENAALELFNRASPSEKAGILLAAINKRVLQSTAFARLIFWFTGMQPVAHKANVRRLRPGLDYTVGSYDMLLKKSDGSVLCVNLCFVDQGQLDFAENVWNKDNDVATNTDLSLYRGFEEDEVDDEEKEQEEEEEEDVEDEDEDEDLDEDEAKKDKSKKPLTKKQMWASDDFGGFMAHVPVDKSTEGDDAEAYVAEDDSSPPVISLSAANNTLTIVKKQRNVLTFVRYINGHAPGSRFDIDMTVQTVDADMRDE